MPEAVAPSVLSDDPRAKTMVRVESGLVSGVGTDIRSYKGLPYAAPPVGHLRWQPPQPVQPWQGIKAASTFGADPMQMRPATHTSRAETVSEDCLTLNVWTPAKSAGQKLPVMVWLYGGAFTSGSGANAKCDGEALARKGVVVVTLNYRVGVFGFLAHPSLTRESSHRASGNYGFLDQLAALRWVQANIGGFGGDAGRVTLFGVSAGGSCVSLLLTSPLAKGLFHQVIMQSPGAFRPLAKLADAEKIGDMISPDLAALRRAPAEELLALNGKYAAAARGLTTPRILRPIIDGWSIVEDDRPAYEAGHFQPVPMLTGSNADEGRFFIGGLPIRTAADYTGYIHQNFGAKADAALAQYPAAADKDVAGALSQIFGDTQFTYGAWNTARFSARQQPKTFRYLFSHRPGGRHLLPTHTEETPFVFGTIRAEADQPVTDGDRMISQAMMDAWVRFVQTGDPNGGDLPDWPAYDEAGDPYLEFGETIEAKAGWRRREMGFIDSVFN